ncbi:MAG: hypothetical protein N3A01_05765 [Bacteroidales bacterium]|nr:hypothetical protein [Bacteroidales bacterium]
MERIILISIIIHMCSHVFYAQQLSFFYFDTLSLKYFNNNNLDSLLKITDKAIMLGYDCYYFRLRRGLALYNNNMYKNSIKELLKSLNFNKNDITATEYLYNAYLKDKQYRKAYCLTKKLPPEITKKYNIKRMQLIEKAGISYLYSANNLYQNIYKNNKSLYNVFDYLKEFKQIDGIFEVNLSNFSFFLNYKFSEYYFIQELHINQTVADKNNYKSHGNHFHGKLNWYFKNKKIALSGLYVKMNTLKKLYNIYPANNTNISYLIKETEITNTNYGFAFDYMVLANKSSFSLSLGFSDINENHSIYAESSSYYSLLKNNKVFANSSLLLYLQTDTVKNPHISIEQTFYLTLTKNMFLSIFGRIGKLYSIATNSLFYVYSYPYWVKYYFGIQADIIVFKHLNLFAKCVFFNNLYRDFITKKDYNFAENIFNVGCIWKL